MRPTDYALLIVAFAGLALGWLWPAVGLIGEPYTVYMMITVLFLAFLRLDYGALLTINGKLALRLGLWTTVKLLLLPLAVWAVFRALAPEWSLPALILSGISAGVTSPFFAGLLGADMAASLRLVVSSTLLAPLSLPALIEWLEGHRVHIAFGDMAANLAFVVFTPLILAGLLRRFGPKAAGAIAARHMPITMVMFFCINAAIAAGYNDFLHRNPLDILVVLGLATALSIAYIGFGLVMGKASGGRVDGLTGAVGLAFCNNVLAMVFSREFFGPETALLSAAYTFPFFLQLIPLRLAAGRADRSG